MFRKSLIIYLLVFIAGVSACKFNRIRKSTDIKEKYDAAINYYQKKEYYKAGLLLEEIIPLITGTREQEIAKFYYGYCHFYQKQYSLAAYYFQNFYETFRNSKFAEEARYMQVRSLYEDSPPFYLDQKNTIEAINAAQSFLNNFTNSSYTEECNKVLKELRLKLEKKAFENAYLYYKIRYHKAAVVAFTNFQKGYPDSDLNEEAAYRKIEAQYLYAKQSIENKQKERFSEVVTFYESFIETYPSSKYKRSLQNIYEKSQDILNKPSVFTRN
jgi:outer membrane protein assembly factor BamD